ncbi:MAG: M14 family metallopeptidase, partial [Candidatus Aminicenantales bacterium]
MKIRRIIFFLITLQILLFPLLAQDYSNTTIISVSQNPQVIKKINELNLDILMFWQGRIYIICNQQLNDLLKIKKAKIDYQIETQKFYPFSTKEVNLQTSINGDYHTYQELEKDLMTLEEGFPDLAKLYSIGQSLENRNIYALKISDNVSRDEDEAEVLFLGCHHAREWISVEVPYLLAKYLVENYSQKPAIKTLVDYSQIWIIPLLNPDGLEYSIHFYRYWRKNRRNNGDGSYGVDLNRNYSYKWGLDNEGSSPLSFSNVYRGKYPFSEPETQAVRDLCSTRKFQALISYHNYSQV